MRKRQGVFLFLLLMIVITLIFVDHIPAMGDWFDRIFQEQIWLAKDSCKRAALERARQPGFTRLVHRGHVTKTPQGYHVQDVILSEMGENGAEIKTVYGCYIDSDGELVKLGHRPHQSDPEDPETHHKTLVYE
jgi:hypothetical protein